MSSLNEVISLTLLKANQKLYAASIDLQNELFDDSASRSYYAVYHAITAILLTKQLSFSSHSQTLGAFNKEFIHTEVFPKSYNKIIYQLFSARETGDYDIRSDIDRTKAEIYIENARTIVENIKLYIQKLSL